ncbi:MAG: hypothetical protein QM692_23935 [Thermomicrobiales bacterium]
MSACDNGPCWTCNDRGSAGFCFVKQTGASCGGGNVCCGQTCQQCCDYEDCSGVTPICESGTCVACSASNPCPAGECCQANGSCVAYCPACQTCSAGLCVADTSLYHTCDGPCPSGTWCNAGVCASIASTVKIPDCQSLCGGDTTVCGETVTCPSCALCITQTGCGFADLQNGPAGPGLYCSFSTGDFACTDNASCAQHAPFSYCRSNPDFRFCARICPY